MFESYTLCRFYPLRFGGVGASRDCVWHIAKTNKCREKTPERSVQAFIRFESSSRHGEGREVFMEICGVKKESVCDSMSRSGY